MTKMVRPNWSELRFINHGNQWHISTNRKLLLWSAQWSEKRIWRQEGKKTSAVKNVAESEYDRGLEAKSLAQFVFHTNCSSTKSSWSQPHIFWQADKQIKYSTNCNAVQACAWRSHLRCSWFFFFFFKSTHQRGWSINSWQNNMFSQQYSGTVCMESKV